MENALALIQIELCMRGSQLLVAQVAMGALVAARMHHWLVAPATSNVYITTVDALMVTALLLSPTTSCI